MLSRYLINFFAKTTQLHALLMLALDSGEWLASRHGHINPLNAELNPICHLLALIGAHHILHVSWIRVNIEE